MIILQHYKTLSKIFGNLLPHSDKERAHKDEKSTPFKFHQKHKN